jgi:hypothetical protein
MPEVHTSLQVAGVFQNSCLQLHNLCRAQAEVILNHENRNYIGGRVSASTCGNCHVIILTSASFLAGAYNSFCCVFNQLLVFFRGFIFFYEVFCGSIYCLCNSALSGSKFKASSGEMRVRNDLESVC